MSFTRQIQAEWQAPPAAFRSAPFWSWNSKLDPERLCREIESMHSAGMGGFFIHSRYGLKTPYLSEEWFACVDACLAKARELGMKAYLYDEDRWPSGSAGGLATRDHKEFRHKSLVSSPVTAPCDSTSEIARFAVELNSDGHLVSYEVIPPEADPAGRTVIAFTVETGGDSGWYNDGAYLDTMNPRAVEEFIRITHQAYAERYGRDFSGLIPAIFTDEPNYGGAGCFREGLRAWMQWTTALPEEFKRRCGYDLLDYLPELAFSLAGDKFSRPRHDYRRTLTELFVENFSKQIGQWCSEHNIAMTGHMLAEETLTQQTQVIGAAMPHYEHMQWPGIDILRDQASELTTAKQCTSVADQFARRRVLSELYGCTGWDWPLEGHKFIGDWQYAVGVNFRCPHLTHYSLAGGAKRDYPASIFEHSPWWKFYHKVEDYFGRLSVMLTQGRPIRDVLVIHPIQSAWGLYAPLPDENSGPQLELEENLDAIIYTLSGGHYDWDFGDESLLAKYGQAAGEKLQVNQMTYKLVIVPPVITLRSTTVKLLEEFVAGGGRVVFAGRQPSCIDAVPSDKLEALINRCTRCGESQDELLSAVQEAIPRRVSISTAGEPDSGEQTCIWAMLREVPKGRLLFIQSHDRKADRHVHVRVEGPAPVVLWDALSGEKRRLQAGDEDGFAGFDLDLPATGSALLSIGLDVPDSQDAPPQPQATVVQSVEGPFQIKLTEPNTLPLDYCRYRIGDGEFSEPMPTLRADRQIRGHFGLAPRNNSAHQPWYLYACGNVDTATRGRCEMAWNFHVTDIPTRCLLALESPQDYEILVNGSPAGKAAGWWVDQDIQTINITPSLGEGDNEVLLRFDFRPDMELENLYLVGEFGAGVLDANTPRRPGNATLIAPSNQLNLSSWVGQGLDYYGASVLYHIPLDRKAVSGRVRVRLPNIACTAAAVHVGRQTFALPWAPFEAEITDALTDEVNEIVVEVVGGRKNILGPLHMPWGLWTGPEQFNTESPEWLEDYQLTDHGLTSSVIIETLS